LGIGLLKKSHQKKMTGTKQRSPIGNQEETIDNKKRGKRALGVEFLGRETNKICCVEDVKLGGESKANEEQRKRQNNLKSEKNFFTDRRLASRKEKGRGKKKTGKPGLGKWKKASAGGNKVGNGDQGGKVPEETRKQKRPPEIPKKRTTVLDRI